MSLFNWLYIGSNVAHYFFSKKEILLILTRLLLYLKEYILIQLNFKVFSDVIDLVSKIFSVSALKYAFSFSYLK